EDCIYVVGTTRDELGASEYYRMLARDQGTPGFYGGEVPKLDIPAALSIYSAMEQAHAAGILRSSHTPTLGGLAAAFALAAIGGDLGADVQMDVLDDSKELDDDARLFSESNSRFLITCAPGDAKYLEDIFHQVPCVKVGTVSAEPKLRILGSKGRAVVDTNITALRRAFKGTLYGI
ncbi:MAG: AIR synthase-related protein, partial [Acidobacteriota bacterium]